MIFTTDPSQCFLAPVIIMYLQQNKSSITINIRFIQTFQEF